MRHKESRPAQAVHGNAGTATAIPPMSQAGMMWPNPAMLGAAASYPEFPGNPSWQPFRHPFPQFPMLYAMPQQQFPQVPGQPNPYYLGQPGGGGWQQKPG